MLDTTLLPRLPARDPKGHKGTYGTVVVVGGRAGPDTRMIGAPALVAMGALRAGAGLARIAAPDPVLATAISLCPSATGVPLPVDADGALIPHEVARALDGQFASCHCLVVGPGLGRGEGVQTAALRAVQQQDVPVVVDADGLNALAEIPELHRDFRAAAILTPHPGEFRTLASSLRIAIDPVKPETRPGAAEALAQRLGCVVVLKGAGTVVSDGQRTWVNSTGNPALATGGTGDVLSGVVAGIVAQFAREGQDPTLSLYDAARVAVWAHGAAADRWAKGHGASAGLLAPELAGLIPEVLEGVRVR